MRERPVTPLPGGPADWPAPPWVRTWSTRRGLDLGLQGSTAPELVHQHRQRLARTLGIQPWWLTQVHGVEVRTDRDEREEGADAAVTRQTGIGCLVLTADCLPVLFCHEREPVVGAAHAGWRGLAAGVLEHTLQAMAVDPAGVLAWLGPAIGPQAFEVGAEVRAHFLRSQPEAGEAFRPGQEGRWWADLPALARLRLARLGVTRIYGGGHCTVRENELFYSYRKEGPGAGRMGHVVWMAEQL
ncbi:peptidoglycan editing factor PgeF [Ferrovum sp.]|uniref:peptidoglycan editing factor PgeF n=1 Tax=Ferrovum sp. TaxID=2609467 RepID=UPI002611B4E2|nr:peptidoglycan editing factor PgeF [Ferrovum sp.]